MSWKIEPYRDIYKLEFTDDLKAGDKRYVLLTSDWHYDHALCDRSLLYRHLEKARELNAPVFVIGDMNCLMQGRDDKRRSMKALRDDLANDEYTDSVIDTTLQGISSYGDQFALMSLGNHETAFRKIHGVNVTKHIVRGLNEKGSQVVLGDYGGYVKIVLNCQKTKQKSFMYRFFHGSGGGGPVTKGVIQTNRHAAFMHSADIVHTGHIHDAWVMPITREVCTNTGKIGLSTQWHISSPTYKDEYGKGEGGWHIERGAPPKPLGCVWLEFEVGGNDVGIKAWLDLRD